MLKMTVVRKYHRISIGAPSILHSDGVRKCVDFDTLFPVNHEKRVELLKIA